ncbi:acyl-CoA synthetase [Magnetospirillum gryphiswaldense]|uniref:3-methylmercaptopropionyl-CoA ligase n=1 Tax=Magnetospirillum gryphiswaldense TaxID=55518 RepID=A4U289_9PROT|nr:acyl-CoA synthetase [Magnetospirillum gryphiswaldense]AVM73985.1 Long-chain-fatty-acid--CoA ligase [Magnetospirillum gryphiswaldense MSR-1]AVM77888.1 Long-chain-fatty-acid--CoA ligase [Magnetospirillum gryphiswaldense]CAM76996.1 catalytic [Magnetospirillum gryphiswaldense MSR-1]
MAVTNAYDRDLDKNAANFVALTPLTFLERTASVWPDRVAVIHGPVRRTWGETLVRVRRLAAGLAARGIGKGDTVAMLAANTPELFEGHFAIPLAGAVLNAINTRLDAEAITFILEHGEAKLLIVDREFSKVTKKALEGLKVKIPVFDIDDPTYVGGELIGEGTYEDLLADELHPWTMPGDEWDAIALNYTSGTTGNPKGVVYHHRGAYLNAVSNALGWTLPDGPVYLWTLPMFHCNGWCFPWTMAAAAGTSVCLRHVRVEPILDLIRSENVGYFCGAPIVLNMINNAPAALKEGISQPVKVMTAGAAPPAAVIAGMERMGWEVTHVYGLTEVYGPVIQCVWHDKWNDLSIDDKAKIKARQGVRGPMLEAVMVADPMTLEPCPKDGMTMGEIFMRGNNVMKGYLKNPKATVESFEGGWFHTGDLAVWHADGYVEIKDRSKDIIISGGENISSIEVEDVLYKHPDVMEAAVVARPDEKWGETPCAFVSLKDGATCTEEDIIAFCKAHMAGFKTPRTIVFGPLPKTSTGKIQKFMLRQQAKEL